MVQDVQVKWLQHGTTVSVVWAWHQDQKLEVSWLYRYKHASIISYAVARKYLQANVSIKGKFEGLQRLLNQECNTSFDSFP